MGSFFCHGVKFGLRNASLVNLGGRRILHTNSRLFDTFLFDVDRLSDMNRRELQQLCKKLGLRAIGKTAAMLDDLTTFYHRHVSKPSSVLHFPYIPARSEAPPCEVSDFSLTPPRLHSNASLLNPLASTWVGTGLRRLCRSASARGTTTAAEVPSSLQSDFLGTSKHETTYLNKVVSVSHILSKTSRANRLFMISKWRKKQIQEMGQQSFKEYATELSRKGIDFHRLMNLIMSGHAPDVPERVKLLHRSVSGLLQDLTGISVGRRDIVHRQLGYRGTFDDLALYRDSPCVIEWKTSQKPKETIEDCFDYPLQVVAYAGALNSDPDTKIPVTQSMVVVAYHDGSPADVHFMDLQVCEKYWQFWLLELHKFKQKHEEITHL